MAVFMFVLGVVFWMEPRTKHSRETLVCLLFHTADFPAVSMVLERDRKMYLPPHEDAF